MHVVIDGVVYVPQSQKIEDATKIADLFEFLRNAFENGKAIKINDKFLCIEDHLKDCRADGGIRDIFEFQTGITISVFVPNK